MTVRLEKTGKEALVFKWITILFWLRHSEKKQENLFLGNTFTAWYMLEVPREAEDCELLS